MRSWMMLIAATVAVTLAKRATASSDGVTGERAPVSLPAAPPDRLFNPFGGPTNPFGGPTPLEPRPAATEAKSAKW
jgi:hypothetical protein